MLQLQLLFKGKNITFNCVSCYIHLAAECDINSDNDKIVQKSNKSLQSASASHMNWN